LPLARDTIPFIIATPPVFGVKRLGERGFCTRDGTRYERMLGELKAECLRILKPDGFMVQFVHSGDIRKIFEVFQKQRRGRRWQLSRRRTIVFRAPYVLLPGFWWYALSVSIYSNLIARFTDEGDLVAHVFSGSGNSAIAAAALRRPVALFDLHYHERTRPRLRHRLRASAQRG
jgi:DNA modification methylase